MFKVGQEVMIRGDGRLFSVRGPSRYRDGRPVAFSLMGIDGYGFLERESRDIRVPTLAESTDAREKMKESLAAAARMEAERKQRALQETVGRHREFLIRRGIVPEDSNLSYCREVISKEFRATGCYNCGELINNADLLECRRCGWIICTCGACGCDLGRGKPETSRSFPDFDTAREAVQRTPGATMRRAEDGTWIVTRRSE